MRRILITVLVAGAITLAAAPAAPAASPIRSFAPSNCYRTVFAHTSGTQYGFTSCTSKHRISLIIGNGSSWRTVKLSIRGTPLAAADNGKLTYLVYATTGGGISMAWIGRKAAGVSDYPLQSLGGSILSGAIVATKSGWRAAWSESVDGDLWQCAPGCYLVSHDRATSMSMALINGRAVISWMANGHLYVGTLSGDGLTRRSVTKDRLGQPRVLSYRGHTAIAFPDYTTNTARLAVNSGGTWVFKTLGSLGTKDTSLVSAGWTSNAAVITWQTPNGLGMARYFAGSWHTSHFTGTANRALAASGTAVMHSDGSALLLGRTTSRGVG
jgi:hypothetical protein